MCARACLGAHEVEKQTHKLIHFVIDLVTNPCDKGTSKANGDKTMFKIIDTANNSECLGSYETRAGADYGLGMVACGRGNDSGLRIVNQMTHCVEVPATF